MTVSARCAKALTGSSPQRVFGFFLTAQKETRPAGRNPPLFCINLLKTTLSQGEMNENRNDLHRRGLFRQSRPRRLGRVPKKVNFFGVPDRFKSSGEVNSPCGKVFAIGKNAWTRHTARGALCALKIAPKEKYMKTVTIYTDGACSGNPGPGGWGAILMYGPHKKEMSGGEPQTTNNRMELTGVISALRALKEPCVVELYSDSKYVIDALEKGWAKGWRARGWVKGDKKPALNPDLWQQLLELCEYHTVNLHWVKGHASNPYNNRCDELAVAQSQKYK